MPIYQYKCPECGDLYETEALSALCLGYGEEPHLNPVDMKRVYTFAGAIFKGSGFYKTDNR